MRWNLLTWLLALGIASHMGLADGPQAEELLGRRVVTKFKSPLMVGNRRVDDGLAHRVYRVDKVDGRWLWVVAADASGWLRADEVVPVDKAIAFFSDQIRKKPDHSASYCRRGVIWKHKGEDDLALADYDRAISLDPNSPTAYYCRGNALYDRNEFDKAVSDYTQAIRIDPQLACAYVNRGDVWYDKKEYDKALSDYSKALELHPNDSSTYTRLGLLRYMRHEYDYAIADHTSSIRLKPSSILSYIGRANAYLAKKEYARAIIDYSYAIRLDPTRAELYHRRGDAWYAQKAYRKAQVDFAEAINLNRNHLLALTDSAWLWATCPDAKYRDGRRAVESAMHACELVRWSGHNQLDTLAAALAEVGDFEAAVRWQTEALNLLPIDDALRRDYESRLELYKARKPFRE